MIETIVVQEMYHFALAGNMLTAIGGTASIANRPSSRVTRRMSCLAALLKSWPSI
jgi:hypothetical protein